MPYIKIRDIDHYYEWIRQTDQSLSQKKPVMVFLHGWGGSSRYWQTTASTLSAQFDCLLYDLKGFGRSRLPPKSTEFNYELDTYAQDLSDLLDALQLDKVYINGHSMGASITTLFVNLYPQRVNRIILTCSGIFEYDEKAFEAFYQFGGYVVKFRPSWLTSIPFVDQVFMARFLHRPLKQELNRAFLEDFLMADYDAAKGTIFASVSKKTAEQMPLAFSQLKIPTLLISGAYDQIIPASLGQNAAKLNDLIEFSVIPNTGHFPMLEDANTYVQIVREFLCDI